MSENTTTESWFDAEKKKIYDETTTTELEEVRASIEAQSNVIMKAMADAEAAKNEYFKKGNLTKALEKDGIVREKEAALETLREYAATAGFKEPMTPAKYSSFVKEISVHYVAAEKTQYEAMLALAVQLKPIIETINALQIEKITLYEYLSDLSGAYGRSDIVERQYRPDWVSDYIKDGTNELVKLLQNKIDLLS